MKTEYTIMNDRRRIIWYAKCITSFCFKLRLGKGMMSRRNFYRKNPGDYRLKNAKSNGDNEGSGVLIWEHIFVYYTQALYIYICHNNIFIYVRIYVCVFVLVYFADKWDKLNI